MRQLSRRQRDVPITAIYEGRPANDEPQNMIWFKTGIRYTAFSKRTAVPIVSAGADRMFDSWFTIRRTAFADCTAIGPSRAFRESLCTGILAVYLLEKCQRIGRKPPFCKKTQMTCSLTNTYETEEYSTTNS